MSNNPRFRTLHEAGKYAAAQPYPAMRGLNPEEFGAIPRYIENPAWENGRFEVVFFSDNFNNWAIIDHEGENECPSEAVKTSVDWYQTYPKPVILMADGWEDPLCHSWFTELITREEFENRRGNSVVDQ